MVYIEINKKNFKSNGKDLVKELDHHLFHEPQTYCIDGDNIVVKYLVGSIVEINMELINGFNPAKWDKIITLKRNDIRAAAESFTYAQQQDSYHSAYFIGNKWMKNNEHQIREDEIFISKYNGVIDKIEFAGLKLTYEGIYETGKEIPMLEEYLGITKPKYKDMLNYKNRYRSRYRIRLM